MEKERRRLGKRPRGAWGGLSSLKVEVKAPEEGDLGGPAGGCG